MPDPTGGHPKHRIPSQDSGMVSAFPVTILPQEEGFTRKLFNMEFDEIPGLIRKRPGILAVDGLPDAAATVKGFHSIVDDDEQVYVVSYGSTVAQAKEGEAWSSVEPTGWDDASAVRTDFVTQGGRIIATDGVNQPFMWDVNDGTTTELTEMPKGKYLAEHRTRLLTAGMADDPLLLRVSHPGDPTSWDPYDLTQRAFEIYAGDDKLVTALLALDDFVLIGKDRSLYALVGTTTADFSIFPLDRTLGIGSHWAAKFINGRAYFPDQHGNIYQLEPGTMPEKISGPIRDIVDQVNTDRLEEATAAVLRSDQYQVSLPVDASDFVTVVYDTTRGRWRQWGTHILHSAESKDYFGSYVIASSDDKQVCKYEQGRLRDYTDSAIEAYVDSLELHFAVPELVKEINSLWLGCWVSDNDYQVVVYSRTDMGEWSQMGTGVDVSGNENDYQRVRVPIGATGRNIQFRLENENLDEDMRLLDMLVTFLPRELE